MIKRYLPFLMTFCIVLSSCSNEENVIEDENQALFKSYKVSRDAQGKYSIVYDLVEGTDSEIAKDISTNSNNVYAYEANVPVQKEKTKLLNQNLKLDNNKINIALFENNEQRKSITIEDENSIKAKGGENSSFLQEYSVEHLGTDEYVLDFKVKEGVNVSFEYNDEKNIYEVHLKEGNSNDTSFTKLYSKPSNLPLRIDFVNYNKYQPRNSAESESSLSLYSKDRPRPRVIISE